MKDLIRSTLLILTVIIFFSCIKTADEDKFTAKERERVELLYCVGDNLLAEDFEYIVEQLRAGWLYTGNRCAIYYNAVDAPPKLVSIRGGCISLPTPVIEVIEEYEEHNSASPEVFAKIVNQVIELYPSDGYGVIFSSLDARGWIASGEDSKIDIAKLFTAIDDKEFDYVIFEADLMAGIEVAYELRDKTEYIIASSTDIISCKFNPIYSVANRHLMDSEIPLQDGLKAFGKEYIDYAKVLDGSCQLATMSLICTSKLEELSNIIRSIYATSPNLDIDISSIQCFDIVNNGDTPCFFDFMHYYEAIATAEQYAEIVDIMNDIVLWEESTGEFMGRPITCHSGLTVYVEQPSLVELNAQYKQTSWYKKLNNNN